MQELTIKELERLLKDNGTDRVITIIFLLAVIFFLGTFLKQYTKNQEYRKERDEKMINKYVEMTGKMTETIVKNSSDIDVFKKGLDNHTSESVKRFDKLNGKLDDMDDKLNVATEITKDIKTDLKDIKDTLKK